MSKKSSAEKALAALIEYDSLMSAISSNREAIGDAPECDRYFDSPHRPYIPDNGITHLAEVFAGYEKDSSYFEPVRGYFNRAESLEIIGDCEGCRQAYEAIQERKANRKKLGAVKRAMRMIARGAR